MRRFQKNKNLSQTKQLSQKGNQDLYLDKSMVWTHHKEILLSEPGRNRRECILTRNSLLSRIFYVIYHTLYFATQVSRSREKEDII